MTDDRKLAISLICSWLGFSIAAGLMWGLNGLLLAFCGVGIVINLVEGGRGR